MYGRWYANRSAENNLDQAAPVPLIRAKSAASSAIFYLLLQLSRGLSQSRFGMKWREGGAARRF